MIKLLENLRKTKIVPGFSKLLPETTGVYIFYGHRKVIYIGKAINLKRRVSSYFDLSLEPKTAQMISEADSLSYIRVTSELEALLLEARLIRKYMPRYNIAAKDDKHPLYIVITKEKYPRVTTARKIDLGQGSTLLVYGPFPSSTNVRSILRILRRIFPYSDHKLGARPCLYSHIGLCDPCPNETEQITNEKLKNKQRRQYLGNIRKLKAILEGKIDVVMKDLVQEMEAFSKKQDYKKAAQTRDQIKRLEYITQPQIPTDSFLENPDLIEEIRNKELKELRSLLKTQVSVASFERIECFDVAHLAGTNPTASMVTFVKGEAEKKFYRHFRVRQNKGTSDVDSLKEVVKRRAKHFSDWGKPDLIIVDGGKPQVGVFFRELENSGIPTIGLAKRFETLVIPVKQNGVLILKELRVPKGPALYLVQRIRDEAHRFARRYHHALISKGILKQR